MKRRIGIWAALVLWPSCLAGQALPAAEDPAHNELRALRDALIDAVNSNNRDRLLPLLHRNVIVTWLNGEVSRGPDQVRTMYDRMMTGEGRVVETIAIHPSTDALADLYGNTAVAFGSSEDHYKLVRAGDFKIRSRWSATAVKEDGKWLVVNFHNSLGAFDNPLLDTTRRMAIWASILAALAGAALGFWAGRVSRRRA